MVENNKENNKNRAIEITDEQMKVLEEKGYGVVGDTLVILAKGVVDRLKVIFIGRTLTDIGDILAMSGYMYNSNAIDGVKNILLDIRYADGGKFMSSSDKNSGILIPQYRICSKCNVKNMRIKVFINGVFKEPIELEFVRIGGITITRENYDVAGKFVDLYDDRSCIYSTKEALPVALFNYDDKDIAVIAPYIMHSDLWEIIRNDLNGVAIDDTMLWTNEGKLSDTVNDMWYPISEMLNKNRYDNLDISVSKRIVIGGYIYEVVISVETCDI